MTNKPTEKQIEAAAKAILIRMPKYLKSGSATSKGTAIPFAKRLAKAALEAARDVED
jgi:hypothetical protein